MNFYIFTEIKPWDMSEYELWKIEQDKMSKKPKEKK